jgi:THO complex subunit 1
MADYGVHAVAQFGELLQQILSKADEVKPTYTIEPPLDKSDLADIFERLDSVFPSSDVAEVNEGETAEEKEQRLTEEKKRDVKKRNQYAIIETAARDTFHNLLVSNIIDEDTIFI